MVDLLSSSTEGCCGDEKWRGLLCEYHRGMRDALDLAADIAHAAHTYVAARMEAEGADSAASRLDAVRKIDYAWFDLIMACGYDPPGHEDVSS